MIVSIVGLPAHNVVQVVEVLRSSYALHSPKIMHLHACQYRCPSIDLERSIPLRNSRVPFVLLSDAGTRNGLDFGRYSAVTGQKIRH